MENKRANATSNKQTENDKVIVTKWNFEPNAQTGWHRHGYDYVIVPCMDGKILIESKTGENIVELKEGESYFREEGVEHNVININDFEFSFVEVELK